MLGKVTEWETANTALSEQEGNLTLDDLREWRNALLSETDWTILPDSPLSADKQAEWKTYRQKLRDLPANTSEPYLSTTTRYTFLIYNTSD